MSEQAETATAARIRKMAQEYHVAYVGTQSDALAHHITRLAGDCSWTRSSSCWSRCNAAVASRELKWCNSRRAICAKPGGDIRSVW